jgi:hypothetical protein
LKKLPSEVEAMTLPQAYELFEYWSEHPMEHDAAEILLRCYTTWKPNQKQKTPEEQRASLEARWKAGSLNIKQLFEMQPGAGERVIAKADTERPAGIGDWPFKTMH